MIKHQKVNQDQALEIGHFSKLKTFEPKVNKIEIKDNTYEILAVFIDKKGGLKKKNWV